MKLSVLVPVFNLSAYVAECLISILEQQADFEFEVIAVDDCSTDDTVSILKEYALKYGLKYFINEKNLGVNANFEKGLRLSLGDYICFCDQDDVWFAEKNETLFKKMLQIEDNGPCIVSSRNTFVDANLNIKYTTERKKDTDDYRDTILS